LTHNCDINNESQPNIKIKKQEYLHAGSVLPEYTHILHGSSNTKNLLWCLP